DAADAVPQFLHAGAVATDHGGGAAGPAAGRDHYGLLEPAPADPRAGPRLAAAVRPGGGLAAAPVAAHRRDADAGAADLHRPHPGRDRPGDHPDADAEPARRQPVGARRGGGGAGPDARPGGGAGPGDAARRRRRVGAAVRGRGPGPHRRRLLAQRRAPLPAAAAADPRPLGVAGPRPARTPPPPRGPPPPPRP